MIQSALRIISIFLICAAATPVVAGPRGGGHFGGGVHFSAGTGPIAAPHIASPQLATPHFSAPSFAPRLSAPRFSAPLMVPHSARNTRIPLTTPLAPQPFARPAHLPQSHMIVGRIGSAPLLGPVRQILPTSRAANAFALSGVHRPGTAQILRNSFFANRPALAHAIFRGRFTQFSSRQHHRFLPIIVVGFIGPLFWPYAYDDFLNYTFYPYAYDAFWPAAYDDVYDVITGVYGSGIALGYVGTGGRLQPPSTEISSGLCAGQTASVTDWRIDEIAQIVEPDEAQRAALEELKT